MRRLYALVATACLAGVLAPAASDYLRSLGDLREQAAAYGFDGERYVLDAGAPGPPALDQRAPVVTAAEQLGSVAPPFLVRLRDEDRPLVVLDLDRTFVKAYQPGVGVVLYLRRVLASRLAWGPSDAR